MAPTTSNLTSAFVDLASYDVQDSMLYGGDDCTIYFHREIRKSSWASLCPSVLTKSSGQPQFGNDFSATVSRAGDYMLYAFMQVTIPAVELNTNDPNLRLRWTRNLGHNLIKHCELAFNDLKACEFDSAFLDFYTQLTIGANHRVGYNNMIGNVDELIQPHKPGVCIPSVLLSIPLPLPFSRDSGVALPTMSLVYNDIKLNFTLRNWNELLIVDNITDASASRPATVCDLVCEPTLKSVNVWAHYAVLQNDERKCIGKKCRDILIEQVQCMSTQAFSPQNNPSPNFDLRFSHPVKFLMWGVRNRTIASEWSNYTTGVPIIMQGAYEGSEVMNFSPPGAVDPIVTTGLVYENTPRLGDMPSEYYSLMQPMHHAPCIPEETGIHLYSYSLDIASVDPTLSTNFSRLSNVTLCPKASEMALLGSIGAGPPGCDFPQRYEMIIYAVNWNLVRISNGSLGFPIL